MLNMVMCTVAELGTTTMCTHSICRTIACSFAVTSLGIRAIAIAIAIEACESPESLMTHFEVDN